MDDAAMTCDAGISSSHHHHYLDDHHQQLQQQLIHNQDVYSDWQQQHISGRTPPRPPSCSYRPGLQHALTAADSTTAGPPTSVDDALLTKPDVGLDYLGPVI